MWQDRGKIVSALEEAETSNIEAMILKPQLLWIESNSPAIVLLEVNNWSMFCKRSKEAM